MTLQSILANNNEHAFENKDVNNDDLEKYIQVRYSNQSNSCLILFNCHVNYN